MTPTLNLPPQAHPTFLDYLDCRRILIDSAHEQLRSMTSVFKGASVDLKAVIRESDTPSAMSGRTGCALCRTHLVLTLTSPAQKVDKASDTLVVADFSYTFDDFPGRMGDDHQLLDPCLVLCTGATPDLRDPRSMYDALMGALNSLRVQLLLRGIASSPEVLRL